MSYERIAVGKQGEDLTAHILYAKGFRIIARNWRCRHGELDIICAKKGDLYIVEVKTRRTVSYGFPEEAVTSAKRERLIRCAAAFLAGSTKRYDAIFFQIASVSIGAKKVIVRLYTDM